MQARPNHMDTYRVCYVWSFFVHFLWINWSTTRGEIGMDYRKTGLEVLEAVGGKDNVAMLTHCATRLRFEFRDKGKVDRDRVEAPEGRRSLSGLNYWSEAVPGRLQALPYS